MKSILVAEDDRFLANAYRVKFGKVGIEVKIAVDGEEALTLLKEFQPDLILLDLMMPKKDGFYVLEKLAEDAKWKTIPVIVASNLGQSEDITRAKDLGARDYFIKADSSLEQVVEKIKGYL